MARSAIVELREYALHPRYAGEYLKYTREAAPLRKRLFPLRLFSVPETGGELNVATHFYHYKDGLDERDEKRSVAATNVEWKEYLKLVRPCMASQKSNIFVQAPLVENFNLNGFESDHLHPRFGGNSNCIYEIRRYQLVLGYETVPNFLSFYESGLPAKLDTVAPGTSLVTVIYNEIGSLNEVVEIWRHERGPTGMEESRSAARNAPAWRKTIGSLAELAVTFTASIHKPQDFSNYL